MSYPVTGGDLVPSPDFPALEERVQAFWRRDDTFQASIDRRAGAEQFVFNDGPPFANGLPHYGHLLTGYVKDVVPRYQTMIGKQVQRRFGWDTHGLPAELEAMRELGITTTDEIEEMGIGAFNDATRRSVLKYTGEWVDYVTRQARWVDFENDYKTLDLGYMESVLWAFRTLYDKGLIYEGYKVLPYCWNDQTPLSNHELRMDDDVYQDRQDNTVTVTFPLTGDTARDLGLVGVRALAWTTTPWTLPTNAALAVGPTATYAVVPEGPHGAADTRDGAAAPGRYLLAEDLVGSYAKELGYDDAEAARAAATAHLAGSELAGVRYEPLFDYYADTETYGTQDYWQILVADYVTTTDGTGLVHQSPAYGEDDAAITAAHGMPTIVSVDAGARFLPEVTDFAGLQVFDANKPITAKLRHDARLLQQKSYVHSYPHCWRCRQPLIYKAVSSWFVRVTAFRERMVELNQDITWVPENVKDGQFGKWLENARDWSISRNRYWGSPIPVWKSDDPAYPRVDVYGSLDEIERDFGVRPDDLHRPAIDALTRPNPDDPTGRSTMVRTAEVLDTWFDSGSMPFAQYHYPFENVAEFERRYPADFIVEYIGQTRGWFYTMHVMATALFDRPAFTSVICHGIVLGDDGQKMSKSLRNYPDVREVFDTYGADAMRWFLMDSPILRGGNLVVAEQGIRDTVRRTLLPLWNVWYFFGLYANAAGPKDAAGRPAGYRARPRHASDDVLDRYLLAKTREVIEDARTAMDALEISDATAALSSYLDTLTNWYVRRSRDRFWEGDEQALDILHTCFEAFLRVAAPFLPLTVEEIWRGLTGERSVHLTDYPDATDFPADRNLVDGMDDARQVVSTALGLRKTNQLRNRLPLASLTAVVAEPAALRPFAGIVADELNVKQVTVLDTASPEADSLGVVPRLTVNARAAGPRLGKQVQHVIKGAKAGVWEQRADGTVVIDGIALQGDEYDLALVADPTAEGAETQAVGMLTSGAFVVLDLAVTDELEAEGTARDVVRAVQQTRKEAGLDVSDRIALSITGDGAALAAVRAHQDLVAAEVLATEVCVGEAVAGATTSQATVGTAGLPITVGVRRASQ